MSEQACWRCGGRVTHWESSALIWDPTITIYPDGTTTYTCWLCRSEEPA